MLIFTLSLVICGLMTHKVITGVGVGEQCRGWSNVPSLRSALTLLVGSFDP